MILALRKVGTEGGDGCRMRVLLELTEGFCRWGRRYLESEGAGDWGMWRTEDVGSYGSENWGRWELREVRTDRGGD